MNYRARVAEAAHRYGVSGAVANRPDGTVFIEVQGTIERVQAFVHDVTGARGRSFAETVERVAEVPVAADLLGFEIL